MTIQVQQNVSSIVRPWHALAYPFPLSLLKSISKSVAAKTLSGVEALGAVPFTHPENSPFKKGSDRRLRVAYVSYCFSGHPTSFLISGIFRHHSKPRFHALCFALNADDGAPERKRIKQVASSESMQFYCKKNDFMYCRTARQLSPSMLNQQSTLQRPSTTHEYIFP